ncbi:MAG: hypothetical protein JXB49_14335, partial [Bacteroidales bacterium]|nr:hypothetical protein [Bacteroidales bacterium]
VRIIIKQYAMEKKSLRQQLIDEILMRDENEDNENERAFLESLSLLELQALAGSDPEEEMED